MIKRILEHLGLGKVGWLEILFALFPILTAYQYGPFVVGLFVQLLMMVIALRRNTPVDYSYIYKPLKICCVLVVVHEIILFFVIGLSHAHMMNAIIQLTINVISIFVIAPKLDYKKVLHSIMWVGVATALGLVYQFVLLRAGGDIRPLVLPFMPASGISELRMEDGAMRPMSFFMEPAALVTFMIVPCFYQLCRKRYDVAIAFIFIMLLSGSTTAIFLNFLLVGLYALTQSISFKYRSLIVVLGVVMFYILFNSELFEAGVNKLNNTEFDNSIRMMNGIWMFQGTDWDNMIFGVPYANLYDFCVANNINVIYYGESVYSTAFWAILVKFGIFILFVYLWCFWKMVKKCRQVIPYIVCIVVALFSQSMSFGSPIYAFQMISIFVIMRYAMNKQEKGTVLFRKYVK